MRPQLPEGHKVRYRHHRMAYGTTRFIDPSVDGLGAVPSARGGTTDALVYGPDGLLVASGSSHCHERDTFSRRIGRDIALGRALKALERARLVNG